MRDLKIRLLKCVAAAFVMSVSMAHANNVTNTAGTYFDSVSGQCKNTHMCFINFSKIRGGDQLITAASCSFSRTTTTSSTIVTTVLGQSHTTSADVYSFVDGFYAQWNVDSAIVGNLLFSTTQFTGVQLGVQQNNAPAIRVDLNTDVSMTYFCTVMGPEMPQ